MLKLSIRIRHGPSPARPTTAWFLPGGSAHLWIAELIRWDVAQTELTLWVVPNGANDRRPRGLLVTATGKNQTQASPRCHPYGQLGTRLYLPVDALVEPEVVEREMEELLAGTETVYLWHPATGLVGFEPSDSFRLEDLLMPPPKGTTSDAAQPGLRLNDRLVSITPLNPQPIDQFLAEGGGDIGTDCSKLNKLTPVTDQPSPQPIDQFLAEAGGDVGTDCLVLDKLTPDTEQPKRPLLERMKRCTLNAVAGAISWFERIGQYQRRSAAQTGETARGDLTGWNRWRLQPIDMPDLQEKRNKAIAWLLEMLQQTPDLGLRYALPIFGGGWHRGLAPPASQLDEQQVDFNLGDLAADGPADVWDIAEESRRNLIERYRQLADREIRMGRYRRAAYIFAHLLGDLHAAASVLQTGGHWREAAQVYRELLDEPLVAAECLEEGGLWSEAVALFEQLEKFEQAGDLHRRLQQPQLAERAYRRAIDRHLADADFLAAARILSTKLAAPREALQILARGWPHSAQARGCLTEKFRLHGQLGEHEETSRQIALLFDRHGGSDQAGTLIKVLTKIAGDYPDRAVQELAKDRVRLLAGHGLLDADPATAKELLESVGQLEPADRLLKRDCHRFQRRIDRRDPNHTARKLPRHVPQRIGEISLPDDVEWQTALATASGFYAAGFRDRIPVVARAPWDGEHETRTFGPIRAAGDPWGVVTLPILWLVKSGMPNQVWIHVPGFEPIPQIEFPETDQLRRTRVGGPSWVDSSVLALGSSPLGHQWTVRSDSGGLTALAYHEEDLVHSTMLPLPEWWDKEGDILDDAPLPFFVGQTVRSEAFVGLGRHLVALRANQRPEPIDLGQTIRSIVAVGNHPDLALLIATDTGAMVVWSPWATTLIEPFVADLNRPILGAIANRWILAADRHSLQMYRIDLPNRRISRQRSATSLNATPSAIFGMPARDQFAILDCGGKVCQYQLPASTAR